MELTSDLKTNRTSGIEITSKYGFDDQQASQRTLKKSIMRRQDNGEKRRVNSRQTRTEALRILFR
ncbi:TPA: hypothetical protein I8287_004272 [Kluyvera intermedia]|nr:hypothetical protein [Kluyvera intermedia]